MKKLFGLVLSLVLALGVASPVSAKGQEEQTTFTVVFKNDQIDRASIEDLGGTITYEVPEIGLAQVEAPSDFAMKAVNLEGVTAANPTLTFEAPEVASIPFESSSVSTEDAVLWETYQWDIKRLTNNGATFEKHSGSHDVVVGIIDTGIDLNHPDVQKNLLPGSKNFVPAGGIYGADKSENADPTDVQDRNGHGTHVAGSIAANGAMLGVAPNAGFKAYRVFGAEGGAQSAWIMAAIVSAANDGVDVINMSLGGIYSKGQVYYHNPVTGEKERLGSDIAEYVAYQKAAKYAEKKGALIVTSAGNDAINAGNPRTVTDLANEKYGELGYEFQGASVYAPGDLPNVVTVASTGPEDELALYSTYGNGYVDVAAPGGNYELYLEYLRAGKLNEYLSNQLQINEFAFSTVPSVEYTYNKDGSIRNYRYVEPSYGWKVGTSMAAPKVATIAALLFDEHSGASPKDVKVMLQQTAEDIGANGHDNEFGHGLTTVYSAFE
ncbi:S8 family peptidase [Pontibacillus salipaludis]|uniref:S8 family peptidase n=1 Tax=Pontibacillus salipaludis TaxID=1697394 RepID=UPI0031EBCC3A